MTHAGRNDLIPDPVTGMKPGPPLHGEYVALSVNWDVFNGMVISMLKTPPFQDFMGVLDGNGETAAPFDTIAPVTGAAGLLISFAYA